MKSHYKKQEESARQAVLTVSSLELRNHAGQFASALIHELRNPLANINLSVEMLRDSIKNNDAKEYLDIILRGTSRINSLVNTLLVRNRPGKIQPGEYSINLLLNEVLELAKDRITLKHITVKKFYEPGDCRTVFNGKEMKIALTNIIVNAIEAMSQETGQLEIATRSIDDKFVIQIRDNGCGISKENLKNIFIPFFTNKPGGLGLGLATASDILLSNHVRMNVESEVGKGTCFFLLFDKIHPEGL